jgi:DNA uptake protein ComE-like DNA-binding protein
MNFNSEPIKNWFGFSRRERRSTFTLLIIIVLIIGLRYTVPQSKIAIENITDTLLLSQENIENSAKKNVYASYDADKPGYHKKTYGRDTGKNLTSKLKYPSQSHKTYGSPQQVIEINRSDSATLVKLPGIGPVLSSRIIKYRRLLGGFASTGQLKEVYGLPPETFDLIKDRISADTSYITRIDINSADYKQLAHIRYLEKYEISSILKFRQLRGRINNITDLIDNKVITTEKATKVGPYLKYR